MPLLLSLFFGTFLAEDLTAVTAGVLVRQGRVDLGAAMLATAAGIYVGDVALWAVGRLAGRRALGWGWVRRHLPQDRTATFRGAFNKRAAFLMLASRLVPGSRLPLYVGAGAVGGTFRQFALWSLIGVTLWTPALVLVASSGGMLVTATIFLLLLRPIFRAVVRRERLLPPGRLTAFVSRAWRWEFWPMWMFYPPVALWTTLLAIRYKGFGAISAANPGIPDGGIVGESKYEILQRLPSEWVIPSLRLDAGDGTARMALLHEQVEARSWNFPLVLKPDVGQRGVGMRVVRSLEQARVYLQAETGAILVQPLHEGPFEAGIFYYRKPSSTRGLIMSITDKRFPVLVGNGESTVEELIWSHPRYRMQARTFLVRHAESRGRVLAPGETFVLGRAGNHAQGAMFLDGAHLITPALESRIDEIARAYPGFFIGRFDVRYRDPESFKSGRDLAIVELNGATAEATDIYDPSRSLWSAYRSLFHQWTLVFEIGAANRARGAATSSLRRLASLLLAHVAFKPTHAVSD